MAQRLRAGIVGTGLIAVKKHIPAFLKNREQVELAAICDVNRETAAAVARRHGIPHAYGDLGEMLMREKLDFVNICTPPKTHAAVAMQVISHGSHVLIEKPMAVSLEECDEIIKASQENGVSVCVAHTDLFYPPFLKAKEMVDRGEIGEFLGMRIFISTPTGYMTSREDHWANRLRGGVIGETGPHIVYMTLAFMNHVVEVHAHGVKLLPYSWSPYEDYRVEFIGERTVCSAASIYSTPQWSAEVDLFGSKGILKMDLETMSLVKCERAELSPIRVALSGLREAAQGLQGVVMTAGQVLAGRYQNTHDLLIGKFASSIRSGSPPPVSAEEGKEAVRVMDMLVQSLSLHDARRVVGASKGGDSKDNGRSRD